MKTRSLVLLLLATMTGIEACTCNGEPVEYPQHGYGDTGYPAYGPSSTPVNRGGYTPPGGYYNIPTVPNAGYTLYPESQSYGPKTYPTAYTPVPSPSYETPSYAVPSPYSTPGAAYISNVPQPTPVGIPPISGYNGLTTIPYVYSKANSSYTSGISTTSFTTSNYGRSSTQSISTSIATPSSSASKNRDITMFRWAWAVAIFGGVEIGLGLHIHF